MEAFLTPEVGERVVRFFGSQYLVYWYSVHRAVPVPELKFNSFRWHCDKGPRAHLKLLVYLNDYAEHGGGTEFLDLESTRKLATTGYVFGRVKTRTSDLGPLAARVGVDLAPSSTEPSAGEGMLFQPSNVLHRGLLPTRGPRVVVTLCLLPSPIPWRDALERGVMISVGDDAKWHDDARELQAALA